jgi:molybdopterin converting factor small subunit
MINVNISLYGAFRQLGVSQINLEVPEASTVNDLRASLEKYLQNRQSKISIHLVKASVFATEELVLKDGDKVREHKSLAILPPVCGG